MIHFENTIQIEQPVARVFAFIANLENLPEWNPDVLSVSHKSGERQASGAEYHIVRRDYQQDVKVIELVQDQKLVIETLPPAHPPWRREITLEPVERSTKIIDHWLVLIGSPGQEELRDGREKLDIKENLEKLKTLLEERSENLQDGPTTILP
jgi:uncharacterized protein YndB with AHSA1/START domain